MYAFIKRYSIHIFILGLFVMIIIPNLLQKGMFVDGLWYATISNNLANGIGSFWKPALSQTLSSEFYEHPPLVFGIQSLFFRVIGSGIYTEKIYGLVVMLINACLIVVLWRLIVKDFEKLQSYWYLPVFLWLLNEIVYLFFPNNMLECTQSIFILTSVILVFKALKMHNNYTYILLFIAGIVQVLSFMSKGFTGLYPLAVIFIYAISIRSIPINKLILYHIALLLGLSTFALLYLFNTEASNNINTYINTQVIAALQGNRSENMQTNRFHIIRRLFETGLISIIIVLIFSLITYFKTKINDFFTYRKEILFAILICLSGVVPIVVSKKQATYYILTTIPYFAIALALIMVRSKALLLKIQNARIFVIISLVLLLSSIVYSISKIGSQNKRDAKLLNDIEIVEEFIESGSTIGCIPGKRQYSMYAFLMRYYNISVDITHPYKYDYVLCNITDKYDSINYSPIEYNYQSIMLLHKSDY